MGNEKRAFIGIEHNGSSHANGLLTLFLVGCMTKQQVVDLVDAAQESESLRQHPLHLRHLHFGAQGSFDGRRCDLWSANVKFFLQEGFWCTLEMRVPQTPLLIKTGLFRQSRFIPLLRLSFPHAKEVGTNAVLQIEDGGKNWFTPCNSLLRLSAAEQEDDYRIDLPMPEPHTKEKEEV